MAGSVAGLFLPVGAGLSAQTGSVSCAGQRIDSVAIHSSAPSAAAAQRVPVVRDVIQFVHITTREPVIRRFLLLSVGDRCDELRRSESERILRAQPFIADASVTAIPSPAGGVILNVNTQDEVALVVGAAVQGGQPPVTLVELGDGNVNGSGTYMFGRWTEGGAYRDGFGGQLRNTQLFARPYTINLEGDRQPLGGDWRAETEHPFYTDLQRIAWHMGVYRYDDYLRFEAGPDVDHALRVDRRYFDVGAIFRLGPPGRLSLFGASITGDNEDAASTPVLVTNSGLQPDSTSELRNRYASHRIERANVLWGLRDIGFVPVRGFDALDAIEDIPVGFELGTIFGRSLSVLGSRDDDIFVAGDMYAGVASQRTAVRAQLEAEGRRSNDEASWDGVVTTGHVQSYVKLGHGDILTASGEWSGLWHERLPFSLTLSDPIGGVRGYGSSRAPGGQRLVGRLENRLLLGRPYGVGDFGLGLFAEAGRIWHGDVPYGVTTPVRSSVGVGLLGAAPTGSARLYRLDFAYAMNPEAGRSRFEVRVSATIKNLFSYPDPTDIDFAREKTVPSSIFRWP